MHVLYLRTRGGERDGRGRSGYGDGNGSEPLGSNWRDEATGQIEAADENDGQGDCKLGAEW